MFRSFIQFDTARRHQIGLMDRFQQGQGFESQREGLRESLRLVRNDQAKSAVGAGSAPGERQRVRRRRRRSAPADHRRRPGRPVLVHLGGRGGSLQGRAVRRARADSRTTVAFGHDPLARTEAWLAAHGFEVTPETGSEELAMPIDLAFVASEATGRGTRRSPSPRCLPPSPRATERRLSAGPCLTKPYTLIAVFARLASR